MLQVYPFLDQYHLPIDDTGQSLHICILFSLFLNKNGYKLETMDGSLKAIRNI